MSSRLQLNCKVQKITSRPVLRRLFAGTLGLVTMACSNAAVSTPQPDTLAAVTEKTVSTIAEDTSSTEPVVSNTETYYAEVGNDGEPDEPLTANIERLNLQPGTPYGEARSRIMAEGWVPYTPEKGASPDVSTLAVRELHELGFAEAQSCSGTGQGFCAFEFVHINTYDFPEVRLVVITTPAVGEPNFYDWRIDNYEPTVSSIAKENEPNYSFLEANATYETKKFNAALYAEVLVQEQDCVLIGDCANSQYLFEDALLSFSTWGFGSTTIAVVPHESVSRTQALDYARMLDTDSEIDFTNSETYDNNEGETSPENVKVTENFFALDLPAENAAETLGSTKLVKLISRPGEDISRIEFEIVVL